MSYPNLQTYFETTKKYRGGEAVWVKDNNGESRKGVLLGCTIANPPQGFGHLSAAQLFQFTPFQSGYIFRSFAVKTATSTAADTDIYLNGNGYSDNPEVGMILMKAPASLTVESYSTSSESGTKQKVKITFTAGCSSDGSITIGLDGTETAVAVTTAAATAADVAAIVGAANFPNYTVAYTATNDYVEFTAVGYGERAAATFAAASTGVTATVEETIAGASNVVKTVSDYTGQSGKVTAVEYDSTAQKFKVTLDTAIGALTTNDIIVEATGTAASATAKPLVTNPNTFVEADRDLIPSADMYGISNVSIGISTVYDKQAWIARMQPLPQYVLAKNRSLISGIFWI